MIKMNKLFRTAPPLGIKDEWKLNNSIDIGRIATFSDVAKITGITIIGSYDPDQCIKFSDILQPDGIAVDLGLSVEWAKANLGGKVETDYGNYYQWGATDVHANTYPSDNYYKGNTDLPLDYDIAHIKLGDKWRIPTKSELEELSQLSSTWTTINGINGKKFTASNGNSIFLPATGGFYFSDSISGVGSYGNYWSSSMRSSDYAYCLDFSSNSVNFYDEDRSFGFSVRAVLEN